MAIGIAALGTARTTRQGRGMAIECGARGDLLRIGGFADLQPHRRTPWAVPLAYVVPLLGGAAGSFVFVAVLRRSRGGPSRPMPAAATAAAPVKAAMLIGLTLGFYLAGAVREAPSRACSSPSSA